VTVYVVFSGDSVPKLIVVERKLILIDNKFSTELIFVIQEFWPPVNVLKKIILEERSCIVKCKSFD
jgi:hypothetical protein